MKKFNIIASFNHRMEGVKSPKEFSLFVVLLSTVLFFFSEGAKAQAPTISYPSTAQNITRGFGSSDLSVRLVFNGICSGATTVKIALPPSVNYVLGSVTKVSGSVTIAEATVSDLRNPVFIISGLTAIGDEIIFKVSRRATCGISTTAKDSVYVFTSGGCSDGTELSGSVNTYNLLTPALSITAPAALTSVVIGTTASRTTVITNGGNGSTDTLRFYMVYPGAGIVNISGTNAITVNTVSFTPSSTSGDTLFYKIFGPTLFGGDNLFSNSETVTITEPIRVAKCNTTTTYAAYWGVNSAAICQTATANSSMTMVVGVPNVVQTTHTVVKKTNMCDSAIIIATIRNNGTEGSTGAGIAYSLVQYIGISGNEPIFPATRVDFNISGLEISNGAGGWVPLSYTGGTPSGLGAAPPPVTTSLSQFTTDPDGAGGLTDADMDGQYDDLAIGQQFQIRYKIGYVCRPGCAVGNHAGSPAYRTDYVNQCGASIVGTQVLNDTNSSYGNRLAQASSLTSPTDISAGEVATIRFRGVRSFSVSSSGFSCATNQLIWRIAVPKGLSLSAGRYYNRTGVLATVGTSTVTSGSTHDTIIIIGSNADAYNPFAFEADLQLNCATYVAPGAISYTVSYICDNGCGCQEIWACGNINLRPHCLTSCTDGGLTLLGSRIRRTTGGYISATASTFVSASSLSDHQLKFVLPYDSLIGFFRGKYLAGTAGHSFTDEFWEMSYTAPGGNKALEAYTAVLQRYNPATGVLLSACSIAAPDFTSISSGIHYIRYDLSGCGINTGDSVIFQPVFSVLDNTSLSTSSSQLPDVNIRFYSVVSASTPYTCDSFSTELYLHRIQAARFDGTGPITNNGCRTYTYSSDFLAANLGFDPYPNEVRSPFILDSIRFVIPAGDTFTNNNLLSSFGGGTAEGYTTATGTNTLLTPSYVSADGLTAVFVNPGSWPKGDVTAGNSAYRFTADVRNSCGSPLSGTAQLTYFYKINGTVHISSVRTPASSVGSRAVTNNLPKINTSNITGDVQGVGVGLYWDVQLNNTGTSNAPYLWMALEKGTGSGDIIIDSVKSIPSGLLINPVSIYNGSDRWYQISTSGLTAGASQKARVFFRYNSCNADSILFKSSWNCSAYPSPDPLSYACSPSSVYLRVLPQPSQIQLSLLRQPGGGSTIDLCTHDSVLFVVNSAQSNNLVNPYVIVYPPTGLTIVSPIKVEYPLGSGDYQNATVSSVSGGGVKIDLSSHSRISATGILGISLANPAYSPIGGDRQAKIKFDYSTDCAFVSGSLVFYGYANRPCGVAATDNGVSISTADVKITGALAAGGAGTLISSPTIISCGIPSTLSLTTIPTSLPTQAGDTMIYTLPAGVAYAGGFTKGTNCTSCEISTTSGLAGSTLVKVKLQTGVASASALTYSFDIVPHDTVCGSITVSGIYKRLISPLSCGATLCLSSSVALASVVSSGILIKRPNLQILIYTLLDTSIWLGGASANKVKIKYINTGTMAYTANTDSVELFCGASSTPFAVLPLAKNLAIGAIDSDIYTFVLPGSACSFADLISTRAKIQTKNTSGREQCLCSSSTQTLTVPPAVVPIVNYCRGALSTALTATGSSLKWYTSASGGTPSTSAPTPSTSTPGTTYYYVSQTSASVIESPRAIITVIVRNIPPAPSVVSPVVYCQGSISTALLATKAVPSDTLIWYLTSTATSGSTSAPVPSTSGTGSTDYYVSLRSEYGCEGTRALVSVIVNPTPGAPVVVTPVEYCKDAIAIALSATGTLPSDTLLWYTGAVGGVGSKTAIVPSTTSVGSDNYYVSQKNSFACEGSRALITVNVNPLPAISGTLSTCVGSSSALTGSATAHSTTPWVSSNTAVATVSGSGVVTGVSNGTVSITYMNSNGCTQSVSFTVNPLPAISGTLSTCVGSSSALTGSATAHSTTPWVSSNTAIATVSGSGVVSGVSAGSVTITYMNSNGCTQNVSFTVNPLPTISGTFSTCVGSSSALTGSATAHSTTPWVSSNTAIATVSGSGVVSGVSAGSVTITYMNANGCTQSVSFTVNPLPTISGTLSTCVGSSSALTGSATAHSTTPWVSSNTAIATVSGSGVVSGVSAGSVTITYMNANGCTQNVSFTVNPLPAISGTFSTCVGSSSALTGSATAHATTPWVSSNTAVATVSGSGVVSGVSAGSVTITYMNSNGCTQSVSFTVNPLPTISGTLSTCVGSSSALAGSATAHSTTPWVSSNTAVATVSGSGVVSGVSAGSVTITYMNSNGCTQSVSFTVNPLPAISGTLSTCVGSSSALAGSATAHSTTPWVSSNTAVATVSGSGVVSGVSAGSVTITYMNSNGCTQSVSFTVNPPPGLSISPVSKSDFVFCKGLDLLIKANAPTAVSFQWYFEGSTITGATHDTLTVNKEGNYSVQVFNAFGCSSRDTVYVWKDSTKTPVLSPTDVYMCEGTNIMLYTSPASKKYTYKWYKDGLVVVPNFDTASTRVVSTGGIYFVQVINEYGCVFNTNSSVISLYPVMADIKIDRKDHTLSVLKTFSNYQWYRNNKPIAGADKYTLNVAFEGSYFVKVNDINGCGKYSDTLIMVSLGLEELENNNSIIKIFPNPTNGKVYIDAVIDLNIKVFDLNGKAIMNIEGAKTVDITSLDNGVYYLMISDKKGNILGTKSIVKLTNAE